MIEGPGTIYESACLEVGSSDLFSARLVAQCLNSTHQSISPGELLCCNDRDRCNEDFLPPTQQLPSSNGRGGSTIVTVAGPIVTGKDVTLYSELDRYILDFHILASLKN